jgi:hypothetical protein
MKHETRNAALRHLNACYGRGDIRKIKQFADGRGECEVQLLFGRAKFTFRDNGRTVYAHRHQASYKAAQ